jgi:hypothetical protein
MAPEHDGLDRLDGLAESDFGQLATASAVELR